MDKSCGSLQCVELIRTGSCKRLAEQLLRAAQQHANVIACDSERRGDLVVILVAEVGEREWHTVTLGQLRDRGVDFRGALGRERRAEPVRAGRLDSHRLDLFVAEESLLAAAPAQQVETVIAGDAHDPSYEWQSGVPRSQCAVGADERFLRSILGTLG